MTSPTLKTGSLWTLSSSVRACTALSGCSWFTKPTRALWVPKAKQVSENLAKMAVIGKYAWENTWIGLFGGIETAYYDRSQIEVALAWLNE
jgi:hypothetical protein